MKYTIEALPSRETTGVVTADGRMEQRLHERSPDVYESSPHFTRVPSSNPELPLPPQRHRAPGHEPADHNENGSSIDSVRDKEGSSSDAISAN